MKYLLMIHSNPMSREGWESFSSAERAEGLAAYAALEERLTASGELIVSEALADPSEGKRVGVRDGQPLTTDGPYAESKEHLAGIFLIDCESFERAAEVAAMIPEAEYELVELRPVIGLEEFEI